ncbi:hypothetical protein MKW94_015073 [Papaver nudicaule]|uniref:PPIase cyclophilin-type domain-containing protein n=1 Tax=Papaver nudicaule TaxID=74823 RepID=A0AA41VUT2_PAPNU|nr:hypothetical protein [Papaver nudicaule]
MLLNPNKHTNISTKDHGSLQPHFPLLECFFALCSSGYCDGTAFQGSSTKKSFMIQGGDPTGSGKGGSSMWGKKHNARGILPMANSGPNTNGSQFFITYGKRPHLNGLSTIFGRVTHGFEVPDIHANPLAT